MFDCLLHCSVTSEDHTMSFPTIVNFQTESHKAVSINCITWLSIPLLWLKQIPDGHFQVNKTKKNASNSATNPENVPSLHPSLYLPCTPKITHSLQSLLANPLVRSLTPTFYQSLLPSLTPSLLHLFIWPNAESEIKQVYFITTSNASLYNKGLED